MVRRAITILSLLGLLLSVGLWGVSYFVLIYVHPSCEFRIFQGGVEATPVSKLERTSNGWKLTFKNGSETLGFGADGKKWKFIGYFGMDTRWLPQYPSSSRRVFIPLWLPTLIFSGSVLWSLLPVFRRRKRKKLGLCVGCGYDLRASEGRCPECGQEFQASESPACGVSESG